MKVVFLDIDGVLVDRAWIVHHRAMTMNPTRVAQLQRVLDETGAALCISSVWRSWMGITVKQLRAAGLRRFVVVGRTRRHGRTTDRTLEILWWLSEHPEVSDWVAIDDEHLWLGGERFVQTWFSIGLTAADADRAIEILGRSKTWRTTNG